MMVEVLPFAFASAIVLLVFGVFGNAPAVAAASACALATDAEVSATLGKPLGAAKVTGPLGSACQWSSQSDQEAYVQIQRTSRRYWSPEKLASGYQKISGVGEAAYAVPELGGWKACALQRESVICVSLNGGRASAASASALLKTSLRRAGS